MAHFRSIESEKETIQPCEQRLALSASWVGDLLLDALAAGGYSSDIGPDHSLQNPDTALSSADQTQQLTSDQSPDLLQQASQLRQTQGLDGSGQTVAVIDSGVAWDHLALGGGFGPGYRVVGGWDFAENDGDPYDDGPAGFHGSHVAGLLAGQSHDFAGVAPGVDIVALRVFDDHGSGQLQWIESALQWVHDHQDSFAHPITTVNLSVGSALTAANQAEAEAMLSDELKQLRDDNILVFAAAGNRFGDQQGVLFPASDSSVMAITSVTDDGRLSDFAQRHSQILATRGESISSAVPEHVYGWDGDFDDLASLDGTSMAAPQAAGASMLLRQSLMDQGMQPTAQSILQRLHETAQIEVDPATGNNYRIIDLARAVAYTGEVDSSAQQPTTLREFIGDSQSQQIKLDLRDGVSLYVDGQTYRLGAGQENEPLLIDGRGGADKLEIIGSQKPEHVVLRGNDFSGSQLTSKDLQIQLRGFEEVRFVGGGGRDRATLYDAGSDDTLTSKSEGVTLSGAGFQFEVLGVPRVYAHASGGGSDTAFLHDSHRDDTLAVRPQFTSLRSEESFQSAFGFERVYAYSSTGGNDTANIYDSAGDDTMNVSANRASISSTDYYVSAKGFSAIIGHSGAGGSDLARIYADQARSQWDVAPEMVQWTDSHGVARVARGFERVEAFEQFEPVDLSAHMMPVDLPWTHEQQLEQEATAVRAVFESLGRDS